LACLQLCDVDMKIAIGQVLNCLRLGLLSGLAFEAIGRCYGVENTDARMSVSDVGELAGERKGNHQEAKEYVAERQQSSPLLLRTKRLSEDF